MRSANGPKRAFVAARLPTSVRGQVARGTFSGPRSRGTRWGPRRAVPSTPARRAKSQDTANGACARTPSHLPRQPGGTPAQGLPPGVAAGRWWCPRAQAPFAVSWLLARLDGDDAAVRCGPRWCPASVGRRTGAPPPPWGAVASGLGLRGQPQPAALALRLAGAQRRTPALGRLQPPNLIQLNANSYEPAPPRSARFSLPPGRSPRLASRPRCPRQTNCHRGRSRKK